MAVLLVSLLTYIILPKKVVEEIQEIADEVIEDFNDYFGISLEKYTKESRTVQRNETLGNILNSEGIPFSIIENIVEKALPDFDVRRVRAGNNYHLYFTNDTMPALKHFVYEISQTKYLAVEFSDSLLVRLDKQEITTKPATGYGIITSSLWNAMVANDLDPNLANKLSEIYAWEVDFYRIQKNDKFKIVYDKLFVGDKYIGSGRIQAAMFHHRNRDFYAIYFEKDTIRDYYNPEGESLRKAFLRAPLRYSRISSRFSHSRLHPVLGTRRPHLGTDYAAPQGTPILAVGDGVVTEARYHGGNGNYVRIRHNSVYETQYLHMSRFADGIRPGTYVNQGDVIGYVGMTGLATGPHVCFRFWKNGEQVDHLKEEFPHAEPLDSAYYDAFFERRDYYMKILNYLKYEDQQKLATH